MRRVLVLLLLLPLVLEAAESVDETVEQLRKIGKLQVLTGAINIVHYGKDSFKTLWMPRGSISAAVIGKASYTLAVDFSKVSYEADVITLPAPEVSWSQLDEGGTCVYKDQVWKSGVVFNTERANFINKQYSAMDKKARMSVSEKSDLVEQAEKQTERIVRGYLAMAGIDSKKVVIKFK